jgi:hypothetical protein
VALFDLALYNKIFTQLNDFNKCVHIFKMTQIRRANTDTSSALLLFFALEEVTISLYYAYTPQFLLFLTENYYALCTFRYLTAAIELSAWAAAA